MTRADTFRIAVRKFGPFESAIHKQWDEFCRTEGVSLKLDAVALDLHPLYETMFGREGLKRGDWDIGFVVSDWTAAVRDTGAVVDLAPLLRSDPPRDYPRGWTPSLLRMQQFGEEVIGLPYHDGPECLIYRKDLLDDPAEQEAFLRSHGKPLALPRTWEDLRKLARFFTRPESNLYGTVFAAFSDGHNTVYDFCLQLWTRGGELFDSAGRMHLDTPQAVDALEFYRSMLNDSSAVHPKCREFDSVQSGLAFARGEIALMVNWFGFAAMCETGEAPLKGKADIADIPHGEGGRSASLNAYWLLTIGAGSPHRDVAYRFLRHCASPAMDKLLTLEGAIGCRKSTWGDPEVNRVVPFYRKLEAIHANAREMPRLANWPELAKVIDQLVLDTINTARPVPELTRAAEKMARQAASAP